MSFVAKSKLVTVSFIIPVIFNAYIENFKENQAKYKTYEKIKSVAELFYFIINV